MKRTKTYPNLEKEDGQSFTITIYDSHRHSPKFVILELVLVIPSKLRLTSEIPGIFVPLVNADWRHCQGQVSWNGNETIIVNLAVHLAADIGWCSQRVFNFAANVPKTLILKWIIRSMCIVNQSNRYFQFVCYELYWLYCFFLVGWDGDYVINPVSSIWWCRCLLLGESY